MSLILESYQAQLEHWPSAGRHILAHYDEESVVVYQAFKPATVADAVRRGRFGEGFSLDRMSWVKPNFLWMMYRSGWATKEGQEGVVAVWLPRSAFDELLRSAVPSSFHPACFSSREEWARAVRASSVRLQWDPDHHPSGAPQERRAIQLGLRGETLRTYAREWILHIEDVTPLVVEQRAHVAQRAWDELVLPRERVYRPGDERGAKSVGLEL